MSPPLTLILFHLLMQFVKELWELLVRIIVEEVSHNTARVFNCLSDKVKVLIECLKPLSPIGNAHYRE